MIYVSDEVAAKDGVYSVEYERLITERYGFPAPYTKQDDGGFRLEGGRMIAGSRKVNIHALIRYNDAIVVETMHTDQSRLVVDDFLAWAKQTFGFRDPRTKPLYMFESHVVVDFEAPVRSALSVFEVMSKNLQVEMRKVSDRDLEYDFSGIALASDPTVLPTQMSYFKTEFSINRRHGRPYAENRFFCIAPLPTDTHIALLDKFDKELLALR